MKVFCVFENYYDYDGNWENLLSIHGSEEAARIEVERLCKENEKEMTRNHECVGLSFTFMEKEVLS